jgi:translation initiation factor IF-3
MGVLPLQRALQVAYEQSLDLVEVSPTVTPPVCRLLDYGRYKYEQTKKERKAKRSQKVGLLKEVRLRPKIEDHDLQAKIRTTRKLLEEGNKVRLLVRFRGREIVYPELGWKVLQKVTEALKEVAVISDHPAKDARTIALTLSPVSAKKPKEAKIGAETQNS